MNAPAIIQRETTLADMLRMVDALLTIRRHPEAILSSMALAGARVTREGFHVTVEFGGITESTVIDVAHAIVFWRRGARRKLARHGAAR